MSLKVKEVKQYPTHSRARWAQKTRVYVDIKDETWWENFGNRTSRPWREWKTLIDKHLREELGMTFDRLRWSQRAGCSCPCSPGFIIEGGSYEQTIWVILEADEPQVTDVEEAAHRIGALVADPTIPLEVRA